MSLKDFGWNDHWEQLLTKYNTKNGIPARVVSEHRSQYRVYTGESIVSAKALGKFYLDVSRAKELPAVGDWVILDNVETDGSATIVQVLPRKTAFSRKANAKRTTEQMIASNIDTIWVVTTFDSDINAKRLERYVTLVEENGIEPVIIISKADLSENIDTLSETLRERLPNVPIHVVSAKNKRGLDDLRRYLSPGHTIALLGSSGVGKSTLINYFYGEDILKTASVREKDGKGRHTTTHRELILLPNGGLFLDTPGMRELQLWGSDESLEKSFADIDALALECRFSDCSHNTEPGCAVKEAIKDGKLAPERLENFQKLKTELLYLGRKKSGRTDALSREKRTGRTKEDIQKRLDKMTR